MSPRRSALPIFWKTGARFEASHGLGHLPLSMVGGGAWVEAGARLDRLLVPVVRIGARYGTSSYAVEGGGSARFELVAAQIDLCPLQLPIGIAALAPFLGVELGALMGHGENAPPAIRQLDASRLWVALSYGLTLRLAVTPSLDIAAVGALRAPMRTYAFTFEQPHVDVATVSDQEFTGGAGVALRIW